MVDVVITGVSGRVQMAEALRRDRPIASFGCSAATHCFIRNNGGRLGAGSHR